MPYENPCDEPGYYFREYGHQNDNHDDQDYYEKDEDFCNLPENLEVNWETPR